jgi:hypothetical protein
MEGFVLLISNFMQNFSKIGGAGFEICPLMVMRSDQAQHSSVYFGRRSAILELFFIAVLPLL